jgi:enterobacterial common antigen flippase
MALTTQNLVDADRAPHGHATKAKSYARILRSTALIGGSSAINLMIGIVRTKVVAVILGPSGVGLMGMFSAIVDLARTLAELGLNSSGVRQIAESNGSGDEQRIARTVVVLRRMALLLGVLGAALLAVSAHQIAIFTFGDAKHAWAVALLGLAVLFRLVADGQGALLQGLSRIGDIAKSNVLGALLGSLASVAVLVWLRADGVALSLVVVAAVSLLVSWHYSRKVQFVRPQLSATQVKTEATAMLRLGVAFMLSALMTMGAAYVVRLILVREAGIEAAGLYQAAWAIGGMYVAFVLQAMGTDFYPRLVGVAGDNEQCNRLVNEQAQVSLMLAGAGVIGTLTFAPWIVSALYTVEFRGAAELLRWICLGMALRVVTWPLGYVLVAKGEQTLFVLADGLWTLINIGLTWWCVKHFGTSGAGIAFFGSYLFHLALVYPICRRLTGFRWSSQNVGTGLAFAGAIGIVHGGFFAFNPWAAMAVGASATLISVAASFYVLRRLLRPEQLPSKLSELIRPKSETA